MLEKFTQDFIDIKHQYFPGLNYPSDHRLDRIIPEIKGAEIRHNVLRASKRLRRHAIGFLDRITDLLSDCNVRLMGRVWVKPLNAPFNARAVYTSSVQALCTNFDRLLKASQTQGMVIADSRTKGLNVQVAHSVFTQKFQKIDPQYGRIVELPSFGHSDNHAGLQACDCIASAVLYPVACWAYCTDHAANVHVQPGAEAVARRYMTRLGELEYRFLDQDGMAKGGLVVSDGLGHRSRARMFEAPS